MARNPSANSKTPINSPCQPFTQSDQRPPTLISSNFTSSSNSSKVSRFDASIDFCQAYQTSIRYSVNYGRFSGHSTLKPGQRYPWCDSMLQEYRHFLPSAHVATFLRPREERYVIALRGWALIGQGRACSYKVEGPIMVEIMLTGSNLRTRARPCLCTKRRVRVLFAMAERRRDVLSMGRRRGASLRCFVGKLDSS